MIHSGNLITTASPPYQFVARRLSLRKANSHDDLAAGTCDRHGHQNREENSKHVLAGHFSQRFKDKPACQSWGNERPNPSSLGPTRKTQRPSHSSPGGRDKIIGQYYVTGLPKLETFAPQLRLSISLDCAHRNDSVGGAPRISLVYRCPGTGPAAHSERRFLPTGHQI